MHDRSPSALREYDSRIQLVEYRAIRGCNVTFVGVDANSENYPITPYI